MRSIRFREVANLKVKIRQKSTKILNIEQFFRIHSCETILLFLSFTLPKAFSACNSDYEGVLIEIVRF